MYSFICIEQLLCLVVRSIALAGISRTFQVRSSGCACMNIANAVVQMQPVKRIATLELFTATALSAHSHFYSATKMVQSLPVQFRQERH